MNNPIKQKAVAAIRDGIDGPWLTALEKDVLRKVDSRVSAQITSMENDEIARKAASDG